MAGFNLMYYSDFFSINGRRWRIELSGSGVEDMGPVPLPADRPLVLEWQETESYEPLQPSSATLRIISESDRRFLETLYSVEPCAVRLDVMLDGHLYWRGTMDTEFYEEPYSYKDGYEVSLTFSDFSVLDRLDFDLEDDLRVSMADLLSSALDRSGLSGMPVRYMLRTSLPDSPGTYLGLDDIMLNSSNFYDEDGKPSSWRDVLAAAFQPLSLRLIQRGGVLYVYDLSVLRDLAASTVKWDGTDALLSRDRVYSRIVMEVSPYGSADLLTDCITTKDSSSLDPVKDGALAVYTSFYDVDSDNIYYYGVTEGLAKGFYIYIENSVGGKGVTLGDKCRYFAIHPVNDGDSISGVLATLRYGAISTRKPRSDNNSGLTRYGNQIGYPSCHDLWHVDHPETNHPFPKDMPFAPNSAAFTTRRIWLTTSGALQLKVMLDVLFDVRYNPYEDADTPFTSSYGGYEDTELDNEAAAWNDFQKNCRIGYIPVRILFYGMDGSLLGHYSNIGVYTRYDHDIGGQMPPEMRRRQSGWRRTGDDDTDISYLAYYGLNGNKIEESCCFGGWQTNKPMVWSDGMTLPEWYARHEEGEIMDNPATVFGQEGYIEMTVMQGVVQMVDDNTIHSSVYKDARWMAYRNPVIKVIDPATGEDAAQEDFELSATLNGSAREELSLNLIVGSYGDLPNCRGNMYLKDTGGRIATLQRNGITGRPEKLLAGSIYSQYAVPKLRLSGTMCLLDSYSVYVDAAMPGRRLFMSSDVQDIIKEESQAMLTELGKEDYKELEISEGAE